MNKKIDSDVLGMLARNEVPEDLAVKLRRKILEDEVKRTEYLGKVKRKFMEIASKVESSFMGFTQDYFKGKIDNIYAEQNFEDSVCSSYENFTYFIWQLDKYNNMADSKKKPKESYLRVFMITKDSLEKLANDFETRIKPFIDEQEAENFCNKFNNSMRK